MTGFIVLAVWITLASAPGQAQVGFGASPVLQTTTTAVGQPLAFPNPRSQVTVVSIEVAPGGQAGRHRHPVPAVVYVLEGTFTIEAEGHPTREYGAGQAFVESIDTWHNGLNRGTTPVKALVVFTGEEGTPTTVRP